MRISNLPGFLWASLILFLFIIPSEHYAQDDFIAVNTYFRAFTEEVPDAPLPEKTELPSQSFRVQLGLFSKQENVEKLIDKVETQFDLPLFILLEERKHQELYRILVGDFYSRQAAKDFLPVLNQTGLKGIIKKYNRWEDAI